MNSDCGLKRTSRLRYQVELYSRVDQLIYSGQLVVSSESDFENKLRQFNTVSYGIITQRCGKKIRVDVD